MNKKEKIGFFDRVQKLRWIERCSNTQHIKPYSVAQHSFYAALYGIIFSGLENLRIGKQLYDPGVVSMKCVFHDIEESETGDILFPLHNEYSEFKEKLDFIRNECVEKTVFAEFDVSVRAYLMWLWKHAKDDSPEGRMVACMDKFEILMYAVSEMEIGNNLMYQIYNNAINIIRDEFNDIISVIDVIEEIEDIYGEAVK